MRRSGFTLVEILCALTLSTALMVAMLGLVAGMSRHADALTKNVEQNFPATLERQLRRDLENCQSLQLTQDALVLEGYLAAEPSTGDHRGEPARIHYERRRTESGRLLQRREHWFDQLTNHPDTVNLALTDFEGFALLVPGEPAPWNQYAGPKPAGFGLVVRWRRQSRIIYVLQ